ncbi:MAG: glycerate kinase [Actinomycetota bacterium]|nr:glycerate kinase [Actinomycetota bacterium]
MRRALAAPDKFKGTASARDVSEAIASGADRCGWGCTLLPLSDGGDGFLEVLEGQVTRGDTGGVGITCSEVTGPLGAPIQAEWALHGDLAIIESARASGLSLAGGPLGNDPLRATSRGTGELIALAVQAGAAKILLGVGGSACTDGGLAALKALGSAKPERGCASAVTSDEGVELVVACDVKARFLDAADLFAPQKGATPQQVAMLAWRLVRVAGIYRARLGIDVTQIPNGGAAGGLAGGLAAIGARLVPGFDLIAAEVRLAERLAGADLVITGEGALDLQSFEGKVVGGVASIARDLGVPVLAIVGRTDVHTRSAAAVRGIDVVSLVEHYGEERATREPLVCIQTAVAEFLARFEAQRA